MHIRMQPSSATIVRNEMRLASYGLSSALFTGEPHAARRWSAIESRPTFDRRLLGHLDCLLVFVANERLEANEVAVRPGVIRYSAIETGAG
jgi:hypothetical protein